MAGNEGDARAGLDAGDSDLAFRRSRPVSQIGLNPLHPVHETQAVGTGGTEPGTIPLALQVRISPFLPCSFLLTRSHALARAELHDLPTTSPPSQARPPSTSSSGSNQQASADALWTSQQAQELQMPSSRFYLESVPPSPAPLLRHGLGQTVPLPVSSRAASTSAGSGGSRSSHSSQSHAYAPFFEGPLPYTTTVDHVPSRQQSATGLPSHPEPSATPAIVTDALAALKWSMSDGGGFYMPQPSFAIPGEASTTRNPSLQPCEMVDNEDDTPPAVAPKPIRPPLVRPTGRITSDSEVFCRSASLERLDSPHLRRGSDPMESVAPLRTSGANLARDYTSTSGIPAYVSRGASEQPPILESNLRPSFGPETIGYATFNEQSA